MQETPDTAIITVLLILIRKELWLFKYYQTSSDKYQPFNKHWYIFKPTATRVNNQQFQLFPLVLHPSENESFGKASTNITFKIYKTSLKTFYRNPKHKTRQNRWQIFCREPVFSATFVKQTHLFCVKGTERSIVLQD